LKEEIMIPREIGSAIAKIASAAQHVQQAKASVPQAPAKSASPAEGAKRILETGKQWGRDDYAARTKAFAQTVEKADPNYRQDLMGEILKQDPNALNSWLTPERANNMEDKGEISSPQKAKMAESVAAAYNNGQVPQGTINAGQRPGKVEEGKVNQSELYSVVSGFNSASGLGGGPDNVANAQRAHEFLKFFDSSKGPEVAEFRTNYGQHLMKEYVLNDAVGYHNPTQRDAAAGLAANLLGGDISRPEIAANALAGYDADQLKTIMQSAARSNSLYGEEAMKVPAKDRMLNAKDISVPDGAQLLLLSVGRTDSKKADNVAVEMARLASTAPDVFDKNSYNSANRVDALTLLSSSHSKAIFDKLTNYDSKYVGSKDDINLQQYMQNASELGALFKTTLFNPDSTYSSMLQNKITAYAGDLKTQINKPGANEEAEGKLAMLSASLTDAVRQGYGELAKDEAAKKEFLGMVVDVALAGLPLGKLASGAEGLIKSTFKNDNVQEALKGLSGKIIDTATGKLTDAAKTAIVDALGKTEGNLEIAKNTANQLTESFFNQVQAGDPDKGQLRTDYNVILTGIATWRKA
jgi:hypothetical protein